jgi:hypothetical protein
MQQRTGFQSNLLMQVLLAMGSISIAAAAAAHDLLFRSC